MVSRKSVICAAASSYRQVTDRNGSSSDGTVFTRRRQNEHVDMGACPGQISIPCVPPSLVPAATTVRACRYTWSKLMQRSINPAERVKRAVTLFFQELKLIQRFWEFLDHRMVPLNIFRMVSVYTCLSLY